MWKLPTSHRTTPARRSPTASPLWDTLSFQVVSLLRALRFAFGSRVTGQNNYSTSHSTSAKRTAQPVSHREDFLGCTFFLRLSFTVWVLGFEIWERQVTGPNDYSTSHGTFAKETAQPATSKGNWDFMGLLSLFAWVWVFENGD